MTQEVVTRIKLDTSSIPGSAAQASRAIGAIGQSAQVSVGQTRNAMRQLPAQFTDIATQIAGGQNIGLILLQQGGQIRDAFGSIGGALRGITSLITPARLALGGFAGVAGALGVAAFQGAKESAALRDTLILTGNAAGLTEGRLASLAERISGTTGQTVGEVRELITTLAASGRVSGQVLESTAAAVARVAELSGRNASEVASRFTGLLRDPARAASALNEQYNFLNEAQARRIRQLADEGRKVEAANLVNTALIASLDGQRRELDLLESAWDGAGKAASRFWEALKAIGRPDTAQQALEASRARLDILRTRLADTDPAAISRTPDGPRNAQAQLRGLIQAEELKLAQLAERIRQENTAADAAAARSANAGSVSSILTDRPAGGSGRREAGNAIGAAEEQFQERISRWQEANQTALDRAEQAERDTLARRLEQQGTFLQTLTDANARASAELITDDAARARALVDLDRQQQQRRIEALFEFGEKRKQAEAEADRARELALQQFAQRQEKEEKKRFEKRAQNLQDLIGGALTAGLQGRFDDIGRQWELLIQQMVARAAAADLIALLFGGEGGNLAGVFGALLDSFGLPGRAGGGSVSAGGAYLVGEQGPEVLVMGGRPGTVVPNAMLASSSGGGFAPVTHVHIDARTDAAQVAQVAGQAVRTAQEGMWQQLRARGFA